MKQYFPTPIDTTEIVLPKDLEDLIENLAVNVHEVWSASRMSEGWTYGEQRDDLNKKHPCLVPYSDLPEMEKNYDRNTSRETLKLILKLGFKISPDYHEHMIETGGPTILPDSLKDKGLLK